MRFVDRNPQKSPEELEFERLDREYYKKFGKQYVFQICLSHDQWDEVNAAIRECLETGEPQKLKPYVEGLVY